MILFAFLIFTVRQRGTSASLGQAIALNNGTTKADVHEALRLWIQRGTTGKNKTQFAAQYFADVIKCKTEIVIFIKLIEK